MTPTGRLTKEKGARCIGSLEGVANIIADMRRASCRPRFKTSDRFSQVEIWSIILTKIQGIRDERKSVAAALTKVNAAVFGTVQ